MIYHGIPTEQAAIFDVIPLNASSLQIVKHSINLVSITYLSTSIEELDVNRAMQQNALLLHPLYFSFTLVSG